MQHDVVSPPAAAPIDRRAMAEALDRKLSKLNDLEDRLAVLHSMVKGRIAFSTSLGKEDQALLHAIAAARCDADVFTLDTGRLFPETLETLERTEQRYGVRIRVIAPEADDLQQLVEQYGVLGFRHSLEARLACCNIRKVRPLERALASADAWITGLRREQWNSRADLLLASRDAERNLIKVNPLADWGTERLDAYIATHRIPVNPLHEKGFASIGCQPCTRAIKPGEDIRAGRWWWENEEKKECGLHMNPNREGKAA